MSEEGEHLDSLEFRRFRGQPSESTSTCTSNLPLRTTSISAPYSVSTHLSTRRQIDSLLSNSSSSTTAIREQAETSIQLEERKQSLASAKRLFKRLARSYLNKRAPPDPERVRELWKYKDILDLETVFTWRDEVGIRRGVLYEDGIVEFEQWPVAPHEEIVDVFENIFKGIFVFPWLNPRNPTFDGKRSSGKTTLMKGLG